MVKNSGPLAHNCLKKVAVTWILVVHATRGFQSHGGLFISVIGALDHSNKLSQGLSTHKCWLALEGPVASEEGYIGLVLSIALA